MSFHDVRLTCGCRVEIEMEYNPPICSCCSPGDYYPTGGTITSPCLAHGADMSTTDNEKG